MTHAHRDGNVVKRDENVTERDGKRDENPFLGHFASLRNTLDDAVFHTVRLSATSATSVRVIFVL